MTPIVMVAAPCSRSGKTTVALAILAALKRRGLTVRALKTGPDYIDPAFHEAVTGQPCANLDSWAMPGSGLDICLERAGDGADLVLIESSMGLFDGLSQPEGQRGAAADIAARFAIPVLLVLDTRGQGQTVGAVAQGLAHWREDVSIAGVILNHIASDRHETLCRAQMRQKVVGVFKRQTSITLPERHLGLVQARERGDLSAYFAALADKAEQELDLDGILSLACQSRFRSGAVALNGDGDGDALRVASPCVTRPLVVPPAQRIALADDSAFSFLYAHLAQDWRNQGAEIMPFSPLNDEGPSECADFCWLPGGYPELHAGHLAAAMQFQNTMRAFASTRPVHGECGGYMVLGTGLVDASGKRHRMLGLLSHETSFATRKMTLGYRQARLIRQGALGAAGQEIRGHEFHYACVTNPGQDEAFAIMRDGEGVALGPVGGQRGLVSGTFFHMLALWA